MKRRPGNGIEGAMVCTSLGSLLRPLFYFLDDVSYPHSVLGGLYFWSKKCVKKRRAFVASPRSFVPVAWVARNHTLSRSAPQLRVQGRAKEMELS